MGAYYSRIKLNGLGVVLPTTIKIPGQWILYYDGSCSLCINISRVISTLDIFNTIIWTPYQSLIVAPHNLSMRNLHGYVYLETDSGIFYKGFYAFRMLSLRVPAMMPLSLFMWIPWINVIGEHIYSYISRNRRCRF